MSAGKSVLVTGSSSGFGRSISETLARQGHTVFATMRNAAGKNAPAAAELRQMAEQEKLALHVAELDVTDAGSIDAAVQQALAAAGRLDVVVNNAGVMAIGLTEAMTIDQIRQMFEVNVLGAFRVNQAALPHMRRQKSGYLIYISSAGGSLMYPFMGVYGATKAALTSLAESLHYEIFSLGIDTTIVQAGVYATELGKNVQFAARTDVAQTYDQIGAMAQGYMNNFAAALSPEAAGDPRQVADWVGELLALPAGQRPLRTPIGPYSEGLAPLNQSHEAVQSQVLPALGLQSLLVRQ